MIDWLRERFKGLGEAFAKVGFYVLFGISIGLALVAGSAFVHVPLIERMLEHLGAGFIVSSIAVLLFEWRSDVQRVFRLAEKLADVSRAEGIEGLDEVLDELVGPEGDLPEGAKDVKDNCRTVILALSDLLKNRSRINDQFVGFISSLQRKVVNHNLQGFLQLSRKQAAEFVVPRSAAELAEDALTAQIQALGEGDRYDVLSDLRTWRDGQLERFQEASRQSCLQRGVRIRRLFNLSHATHAHMSEEQIRRIVGFHRDSAAEMMPSDPEDPHHEDPLYQVRWVDQSMLGAFAGEGPRLHFGLITLREGDGLRYDFAESDLSRFLISPNPDQVKHWRGVFEGLWKKGRELKDFPFRQA